MRPYEQYNIAAVAVSLGLALLACNVMPEGRSVSTPNAVPSPSELTPQTSRPTPTRAAAPGDGLRTRSPDEQRRLDRALIAAAWQNDMATARRLIEQGADVNATDDTVQSAYLIATSEGYRELLELTLAHGADVRSLDSYDGTGLIRAAERGHSWVVGRLVRAGIEVDHVNRLGWVGLHEALIFAKPDRPSASTEHEPTRSLARNAGQMSGLRNERRRAAGRLTHQSDYCGRCQVRICPPHADMRFS